jgi:sec-independent protein translocase protein TatA
MSLGVTEMVLLLAVVLLLFGAGKLPTVMGDLAKGIRDFKAGLKDEPTPTAPAADPPRLPPPPTTPQ